MILPWTCALLLTAPLMSEGSSEPEGTSQDELSDSPSLLPDEDSSDVTVDGFLRVTRIDATGGSPVSDGVLGTRIDHARLRLTGEIADFSWRISVDALNSELSLQDAWISHEVNDDIEVTFDDNVLVDLAGAFRFGDSEGGAALFKLLRQVVGGRILKHFGWIVRDEIQDIKEAYGDAKKNPRRTRIESVRDEPEFLQI